MIRTTFASCLVVLGLAISCAIGCAGVPTGSEPRAYTLVLIRTGPKSGQLSEEENGAAFAGHFANMGRLAAEHKLVVAGPFGSQRHDDALRGLFVLNTGDRSEATAWASTDPTTQAGVFVLEYHDLATDAPLVAALDRSLQAEALAAAEGRTLQPGERMRPYVLLTAEDGAAAQDALAALLNGGGVFLLARLDGSRTLALLDAQDVEEAARRFDEPLARLGTCTLDDWYASRELATLDTTGAEDVGGP